MSATGSLTRAGISKLSFIHSKYPYVPSALIKFALTISTLEWMASCAFYAVTSFEQLQTFLAKRMMGVSI